MPPNKLSCGESGILRLASQRFIYFGSKTCHNWRQLRISTKHASIQGSLSSKLGLVLCHQLVSARSLTSERSAIKKHVFVFLSEHFFS